MNSIDHDSKARLLCLACYKNRLASLFDSATEFQFFRLDDNTFYPAGQLSLPIRDPLGRASMLCSCGVNFLLCGAISEASQKALEDSGIETFSWIRGEVPEVLSAWQKKTLASLAMPGCGSGR